MWFKQIGFTQNPFHTKENGYFVIDYGNSDEIIEQLKSDNWVLLSGKTGSGKSSTLLKVKNKLSKEGIVIRINGKAIAGQLPNFEKDYYNGNVFRLWGMLKKNKDVYVIIDELQSVHKDFVEQIEGFCNDGFVKGVVAAMIEDTLDKLDCRPTLERRLVGTVKTKDLSVEDCLKIIRNRLNIKEDEEKIFSKNALRSIITENRNIPYLILLDCMDICRTYLDKAKNELITETDVLNYYEKKKAKKVPSEKLKEEITKKTDDYGISGQQISDLGLNPIKKQDQLIALLYYGKDSPEELAEEMGAVSGTIYKMLNRLVKRGLVMITEESPKKRYGLTLQYKQGLAKR